MGRTQPSLGEGWKGSWPGQQQQRALALCLPQVAGAAQSNASEPRSCHWKDGATVLGYLLSLPTGLQHSEEVGLGYLCEVPLALLSVLVTKDEELLWCRQHATTARRGGCKAPQVNERSK